MQLTKPYTPRLKSKEQWLREIMSLIPRGNREDFDIVHERVQASIRQKILACIRKQLYSYLDAMLATVNVTETNVLTLCLILDLTCSHQKFLRNYEPFRNAADKFVMKMCQTVTRIMLNRCKRNYRFKPPR